MVVGDGAQKRGDSLMVGRDTFTGDYAAGGLENEHQLKTYLVASGLELAKVSAGRAFFR